MFGAAVFRSKNDDKLPKSDARPMRRPRGEQSSDQWVGGGQTLLYIRRMVGPVTKLYLQVQWVILFEIRRQNASDLVTEIEMNFGIVGARAAFPCPFQDDSRLALPWVVMFFFAPPNHLDAY